MVTLSIVIPAYNEEERIPRTLQALREFMVTAACNFQVVSIIVVDDGSIDGTHEQVKIIQQSLPEIQFEKTGKRKGKGAAVRRGINLAQGDWVLVADADNSTPWDQLNQLEKHMDSAPFIIGSRRMKGSEVARGQNWLRQLLGALFNKVVRWLLLLDFQDTQCGFKLLKNDDFFRENILVNLCEDGFAWDIEILLYARRFSKKTIEVPIKWIDDPRTRVNYLCDGFQMLKALLFLRKKFLK